MPFIDAFDLFINYISTSPHLNSIWYLWNSMALTVKRRSYLVHLRTNAFHLFIQPSLSTCKAAYSLMVYHPDITWFDRNDNMMKTRCWISFFFSPSLNLCSTLTCSSARTTGNIAFLVCRMVHHHDWFRKFCAWKPRLSWTPYPIRQFGGGISFKTVFASMTHLV